GVVTVNALASVPPVPPGLVTVTSRAPPPASLAIVNVAVNRVDDTKTTPFTVIPTPALTPAPLTNPLPSIVTDTAPPAVPSVAATAVTARLLRLTVAGTCTDGPTDNVARNGSCC